MARFAFFVVTTLVLPLIFGPEQAWAGTLSGSWRGGGTLISGSGTKEKVRCRVKIKQSSSRTISLTANCATTSGKANQTMTLRAVSKSKYTGSFHNQEHNANGEVVQTTDGKVVLTVRGGRLGMRMVSSRGKATLTLRR